MYLFGKKKTFIGVQLQEVRFYLHLRQSVLLEKAFPLII